MQKEFEVNKAVAFEMLLLFDTWHDMEPAPYPDEPEDGYDG